MKAQSMTGQKKNHPGAGTSRHRASASRAMLREKTKLHSKTRRILHHRTMPTRAAKAAGMTTAHATCAFRRS
jgi:hypothetical protein